VPYDSERPGALNYLGKAVEEFPTADGPADYALCADGVALGVVEAKKVSLGRQRAYTGGALCARPG
jgi:type I restriction enzyme R subunit